MDNMAVYKKTIGFSLRRLAWDILSVLSLGALCIVGFLIADKAADNGIIGLLIGLVIGIVVLVILLRWVSYKYKAGQIAMMTRGVTEGTLPDDVIGEGNKIVKERFATVAAFFAVTNVIKGVFNEISRVITKVGESIGGDTGSTVGSVISSVISVVISYLCDCCLGWVFFRQDVKSAKATCEGAVLFFKHWKTLAKNMARVFVFALVSLLVIGGVFFGIAYLIFSQFPAWFEALAREFAGIAAEESAEAASILTNPGSLTLIAAAAVGVIFWLILHSVFVRPFVLVGVLRNYMAAGVNDIPEESSFDMLDSKSKKFQKQHAEAV
jgi:F0F1-type ATP synthase assembly protein I